MGKLFILLGVVYGLMVMVQIVSGVLGKRQEG
jgi:hypothetical protein